MNHMDPGEYRVSSGYRSRRSLSISSSPIPFRSDHEVNTRFDLVPGIPSNVDQATKLINKNGKTQNDNDITDRVKKDQSNMPVHVVCDIRVSKQDHVGVDQRAKASLATK